MQQCQPDGAVHYSSRLKKELQDPNPWITKYERMRMKLKKMGLDQNDDYLMMHIMNNLPSAYDGLMENLEDELDCTIEPLTLSVLRENISEKYERIKRRQGHEEDNSSSDKNEDRAMFAKTFKGRCRKCGECGHKAVDCRSD